MACRRMVGVHGPEKLFARLYAAMQPVHYLYVRLKLCVVRRVRGGHFDVVTDVAGVQVLLVICWN
jgi:hypothetical protein